MSHPQPQLVPASHSPLTLNSWNVPRDVKDDYGRPTGRLLSAIDRLYARFASMYMQKWSSHFTTPDVIEEWKRAWSMSMMANGVTFKMALAGVAKCSREYPKWPPSEGEFIALCKPPMDFEQAFHEANRQLRRRHGDASDIWPVPAIYWAALDFGQYELRNASYKQAEARWVRLLTKRMESDCEPVPMFVPALAAPARNEQGEAITLGEAQTAAYKAMAALALRKPSPQLAIERAKDTLAKFAAGAAVTPFQVAHAREVIARLGTGEADEA